MIKQQYLEATASPEEFRDQYQAALDQMSYPMWFITVTSIGNSGALAPSTAGKFGFELTFDPPLPFPSPTAYARLWVDDHLLFPRNTTLNPSPEAASSAPLWIPLPPRALRGEEVVRTE